MNDWTGELVVSKVVVHEEWCIELHSLDGRVLRLKLTADCCSDSFFEAQSVAEVKALVGQTLLRVEHVESGIPDNCYDNEDHRGCLKYHAVKLTTTQEVVVLDWRNDSNGYYDGECVIHLANNL